MYLFLILAVPLSYIYILMLREQTGDAASTTAVVFLKGVLAFLIVLAVMLIAGRAVPRPYSGYGVYLYASVFDFAIPILGSTGLFFLFTRDARGYSPGDRSAMLLAFLAGSLSLESILDLFLRGDYFGIYELMLLPSLRISGVFFASLLFRAFGSETFWTRYTYLLLLLLLPFLLGVVYFLMSLNIGAAAVALSGVLFAVTWFLLLFTAGKTGRRSRLLQ